MASYLEIAGRGANAWWRYLAAALLALALWILIVAAITIALQLAHLWPADFAARIQDPSHPVSFFGLNGAVFLLLVAAFAIAIRLLHKKRFGDIVGEWTWRGFGLGFAVWTVALAAATALDYAIAPHGFAITASHQTARLALAALVGLAAQTFAEEFLFRGYLTQGLLLLTKRAWPTAVVSGLLFGALHIPNGWPQAVNAACFGVLFSLIAIRTGGIAVTFGLHLANNLFGAVVVVSGDDVFRGAPGLLTQHTPGLMWSDAAVSVVILAAVALAIGRMRWRLQAATPEP